MLVTSRTILAKLANTIWLSSSHFTIFSVPKGCKVRSATSNAFGQVMKSVKSLSHLHRIYKYEDRWTYRQRLSAVDLLKTSILRHQLPEYNILWTPHPWIVFHQWDTISLGRSGQVMCFAKLDWTLHVTMTSKFSKTNGQSTLHLLGIAPSLRLQSQRYVLARRWCSELWHSWIYWVTCKHETGWPSYNKHALEIVLMEVGSYVLASKPSRLVDP